MIICPNPICKSIIPDDSKFCPDCGTAIKNIASLRTEAKDIVEKYPEGYKALVDSGILPHFSEYLSTEGYELIIKKKSDIVQKHTELIRDEAKQISISYPQGYEYCVSINNIPQYSDMLSIDGYNKIISNRELIIRHNNRLLAKEQLNTENKVVISSPKPEHTKSWKSAYALIQRAPQAYRYFVKAHEIPKFSDSNTDCKKILSYADKILSKQKEFNVQKEQSKKSELQHKVELLITEYKRAYFLYVKFGVLPVFTPETTAEDLQKIINYESKLQLKQKELLKNDKTKPPT